MSKILEIRPSPAPSAGMSPDATSRDPYYEPFVDELVVAAYLQISPRRVLEMARKGEIPRHPIGHIRKTWRFRMSEIHAHFSTPEDQRVVASRRQFPQPVKGKLNGYGDSK